eukprot:UN11210
MSRNMEPHPTMHTERTFYSRCHVMHVMVS